MEVPVQLPVDRPVSGAAPAPPGTSASSWYWRLPVPWLLALRYFRSTRKDASIRFLSSMTRGGVALGVAALVLAVAALSGFQARLLGEVLGHTPQLQIDVTPDSEGEARRALALLGVAVDVQVVLVGRGWIADNGRLQPVEIVGYEKTVPAWFPGVEASGEGILLALGVARRWGVVDGQRIELISPRSQLSPIGPIPRNRFLPVAGTFVSGRSQEFEGRVAIPLDVADQLLWPSDRRLDVELDGSDPEAAAKRLRADLPDSVRVQTARDLNRSLFFALRLEKTLMFFAVFLIVVVASQTLISSLALVIANKTSEIGMLSAMGMTPRQLGRTFVALGALLGTTGILAGATIGSLLAWILDRYRLLPLPDRVYIVDYVPFLLRFDTDLPVILLSSLVLTLLAALSAGKKAGAMRATSASFQ